jgi:hypothetical protein
MASVSFEPDAITNTVSVETLAANTAKQIVFEPGANGVHIENLIAAAVFFKLDEAFAAVPAGGVYEAGGFIRSSGEGARKFSERPLGAGHTLNLITAGAGDVVVEFLVL